MIPGFPAIASVSPGDIKVLTPPELAEESDEDVGVLPIESAVKPSDEVEDLSSVAAEIIESNLRILCLGCQSMLVAREQALSIEHQMTLFRRMLCLTFAIGSDFTPFGSGAMGLKIPNQICLRLKILLLKLPWIILSFQKIQLVKNLWYLWFVMV